MTKVPLILFCKLLSAVSRFLNIGAGSTWPGHIALFFFPKIIPYFTNQLRHGVIVIAGTNGKTTTNKMITTILRKEKFKIVHNPTGANLLNGIASSLLAETDWKGKLCADFGIFEVDEATLPLILEEFTPKVVVILNLFRDQLDRYGEIDMIAEKWRKVMKKLPKECKVILNGDDPEVAEIGKNTKAQVFYFGSNDSRFFLKEMQHAVDSVFCPSCDQRLSYKGITFSHLGIWFCPRCKNRRPKVDLDFKDWDFYPLPGVYNCYNTLAAIKVSRVLGIEDKKIKEALRTFEPAFGRQEEIVLNGKKVKILLSKNPTGFNESIRTFSFFPKKKVILLVLNDRIPDGRDVSWIWDVDFEMLPKDTKLIVSGDRAYDLALRIKYGLQQSGDSTMKQLITIENLEEAIEMAIKNVKTGDTLYILPTYTAMLEVRKILTQKSLSG